MYIFLFFSILFLHLEFNVKRLYLSYLIIPFLHQFFLFKYFLLENGHFLKNNITSFYPETHCISPLTK